MTKPIDIEAIRDELAFLEAERMRPNVTYLVPTIHRLLDRLEELEPIVEPKFKVGDVIESVANTYLPLLRLQLSEGDQFEVRGVDRNPGIAIARPNVRPLEVWDGVNPGFFRLVASAVVDPSPSPLPETVQAIPVVFADLVGASLKMGHELRQFEAHETNDRPMESAWEVITLAEKATDSLNGTRLIKEPTETVQAVLDAAISWEAEDDEFEKAELRKAVRSHKATLQPPEPEQLYRVYYDHGWLEPVSASQLKEETEHFAFRFVHPLDESGRALAEMTAEELAELVGEQ